MLRLTVWRKRQQYRLVAHLLNQANKIGDHLRIVVAGKRILNYQHHFRFLLCAQFFQLLQRGIRRTVANHLLLQRRHGEQREIDHTDMLFRQLAHPRLVNKEVKGLRRMRHQRRVGFNRRHQMVADRAQIAAVVKLEETRTKLRDVNFNRALGRAGFTGQTAGHRLLNLMREIVLSLPRVPAIAGTFHQVRRLARFSGRSFSS